MQIVLLEGFYSGSHRQWADGLKKHSSHDITILSLPGRFWKWRMHGGAITLAQQFNQLGFRPDLILASDMIDLSVFLSLTRKTTFDIPCIFYFHENQLTYPWSDSDPDQSLQRNLHYAFINYHNALSADRVLFNSEFHRTSFLEALPAFLKNYPDHQNVETLDIIATKSAVLAVGVDIDELQQQATGANDKNDVPHILWNHRWEYDKNPDVFFRSLYKLQLEEIPFKLIVLGEQATKYPPTFVEAQIRLKNEIVQWGHAPSRSTYIKWLHKADILPVTSQQDFFGISVVEAIACNTYPLLPDRLAYPEHVPLAWQEQVLYSTSDQLYAKLKALLVDGIPAVGTRDWVQKYGWDEVTLLFEQEVQALTMRFYTRPKHKK